MHCKAELTQNEKPVSFKAGLKPSTERLIGSQMIVVPKEDEASKLDDEMVQKECPLHFISFHNHCKEKKNSMRESRSSKKKTSTLSKASKNT
jgi:hypothetical protein